LHHLLAPGQQLRQYLLHDGAKLFLGPREGGREGGGDGEVDGVDMQITDTRVFEGRDFLGVEFLA